MRRTWVILGLFPFFAAAAQTAAPPSPVLRGAQIYLERCALCHGNYGLGEGMLAVRVPDYPDTRLVHDEDGYATPPDRIEEIIRRGGMLPDVDARMPPFEYELGTAELEAITHFVVLLQVNRKRAYDRLNRAAAALPADLQQGRRVFETRCAACHGREGRGDGPRAFLFRDAPPADLTASRLDRDAVLSIVREGGAVVGRSPHMPAWKTELTDFELRSVVDWVMTRRQRTEGGRDG
ncbi:MAG: hypothetical protein KatS3mg121_1340 [Gammaproteobacteria bacterium]|nr:MAG: hypothetical protein KatS3mg121_1340 [Gammaproteobacteria bacterium]